MKILTLTIAMLLAGCSGDHHDRNLPPLPQDRAPRISEMIGLRLGLELSYPNHPDAGWAAWRGAAEVTFGGPQAGLGYLPAEATLLSGFEDLDGCLSSGEARWSLDETTGVLTLIVVPRADGYSELTLVGTLIVASEYDPIEDDERGGANVISHVEGLGDWTVLEGSNCDPDDFAGGTQGVFTAREIEEEEASGVSLERETYRGPRARLLVIDDAGELQAEIIGPAHLVVALAAGER